MSADTLEIRTRIQIAKPQATVFEAIVDPAKMSGYFISEGSGRMERGAALNWRFPEFDMDVPVRVQEVKDGNYISYYWDAAEGSQQLLVEMLLEPGKEPDTTVVTITEKSMKNDETGIKWLKSNTAGWANFLDCLKAYLEYGINLRKGAFDYMKS